MTIDLRVEKGDLFLVASIPAEEGSSGGAESKIQLGFLRAFVVHLATHNPDMTDGEIKDRLMRHIEVNYLGQE